MNEEKEKNQGNPLGYKPVGKLLAEFSIQIGRAHV